MKTKYILERFPLWMVFGQSEKTCDVADTGQDIACRVAHETAARMIYEHNRLVEALIAAIGDDEGSRERLERAVKAASEVERVVIGHGQ